MDRQRHLRRLQAELLAFRDTQATVQTEVRQLVEIQGRRPLAGDERLRLRAARWESERLQYELQRLRDEYLALQGPP